MKESSSNLEDRNRKVVPSHLTIKIKKKKGESLQELLISIRGENIWIIGVLEEKEEAESFYLKGKPMWKKLVK